MPARVDPVKRHHVDVRMLGEGLPDSRAVPVDKVEHTLRYARFLEDLGENDGVERRNLARLQHHGAAGRKSGSHLAGDLVQGPVPGRDQTDDADRLLDDE